MKPQENTRVIFDPISHSYFVGEKQLIGVTTLMKKHGLSADYSGIKDEVLENAARLGSQAHETIEAYCNGEMVVETSLVKSFKKLGLKVACCEFLISDNETVASSIDLLCDADEEGVYDLVDMKRTSTLHKDALSWQLGIYKYLFELSYPDCKVRNCYGLQIKKGSTEDISTDSCAKPTLITPVDGETVKKLLECEKEGKIFSEVVNPVEKASEYLAKDLITEITRLVTDFAVIEAQYKKAEECIKAYKGELYRLMMSEGIEQMHDKETGLYVKLKKPYERITFDTKGFKEKYPEIYDKYSKAANVEGSVLFSVKN